jgi:hypothetical protein
MALGPIEQIAKNARDIRKLRGIITDDVLEFVNSAALPVEGKTSKIYITLDENKIYRWTGTEYQSVGGGGDIIGKTANTGLRLFAVINSLGVPSLQVFDTGDVNNYGPGGILSNTVYGTEAFRSNVSGAGNTIIGYQAGNLLTTGTDNVAVGRKSLMTATTGARNVAIGPDAMRYGIVTGNENVAIGYNSMRLAASARWNVAIGLSSLNNVVDSAEYNTAVGVRAMSSYTGGSTRNTGIGYQALPNLTTGGNNTGIGTNAGGGITTGSGNTIIGSVGGLSATLTNTVAIGDGSGNLRVYIPDTGNVLIGTTTDNGYLLDVNGTVRINGALTLPQNNTVFLNVGTFAWFADLNNILRLTSGGIDRLNLGTNGVLTTAAYYGSQIGSNTNPEAYSYSIAGNLKVDLVNRNLNGVNKNIFLAQTTGVGSVLNAPILRYFYAVKGAVTGFTSYRGIEIEDLDSYFGTTSGNVMIGTTTNAGYKLDVNGSTRVKGNSLTISASGLSSVPANYVGINFDDSPNHHLNWFAINSKADPGSPITTGYNRIIFPTMGAGNAIWNFNALGGASSIQLSAVNSITGNFLTLNDSAISFCGVWSVASIDRTNRKLIFGNMLTDVNHLTVYDIVIKGAKPNEGNYGGAASNGGNVYIVGGTPAISPTGNHGNVLLAHDGTSARGNVGIGTSSPTTLLEVNGTSTFNGDIIKTDGTTTTKILANATTGAILSALIPSFFGLGMYINRSTVYGYGVVFGAQGSTSGNISGANLTFQDLFNRSVSTTNVKIGSTGMTSTNDKILDMYTDGTVANQAYMRFWDTAGWGYIYSMGISSKAGHSIHDYDFRYGASDLDNGTLVYRVFGVSKNIGIGTTTDSGYKLDVNGTARTGNLTVGTNGQGQITAGTLFLQYPATISYPSAYGLTISPSTAGTGVISVDGSSMRFLALNNGITFTQPSGKSFLIKKEQGGADTTSFLNISGADQTDAGQTGAGGVVRIFGGLNNGTAAQGMVILAHDGTSARGNVGVGEASPTARLQVKGSGSTSATTSLLVQNSLGNNAMQITDNLGIIFPGKGQDNFGVYIGRNVAANWTNSSGSTVIGDAADVSGNAINQVIIGKEAIGSASGNINIGYRAGVSGGSNGNSILIGNAAGQHGVAVYPTRPIGIGGSVSVQGTDSIAIGTSSKSNASNSVAIGNLSEVYFNPSYSATNGIAIGANSFANQDGRLPDATAIAIGYDSYASYYEFVSGAPTFPIKNVYFGSGAIRKNGLSNGVGVAYTINGSGAFGTNFAGGDLTLAGGKGTGSGTAGNLIFSTSTVGSSGTTLQTLTERMRINGSGNVLINTTTDSGYKLDVNGTARVTNLRSGNFYAASPLDVGISGTGFMATFQYGAVAGGGSLFFVRAGFAAGGITSSRYEDYDLVLGAGNFGSTLGIAIRPANVGGVKIGGDNTTVTHVDSAILNVESTTKGVLFPRMTTPERVAIASPANGLIVFDTDVQNLCYRRDNVWVQVAFNAV